MSDDVIISVEKISKRYRLGETAAGTLREAFARWVERRRGVVPTREEADRREIWALRDVSFEVKRGEVLGIIGKNGAGKSTLLKILSRITEPTSGRAVLRGRVASLLEVGTGFHPDLTGRENIYLNGAILGMKKAEIARKFDEIVAFAELERFIDTPVKRYSSGMYVRLAFAVAAHLEPEILLVDEVLAVGDASFQRKCLGKMGEVSRAGRTVLFVSHNMNAIRQLCGRTLLFTNGRIEQDAAADITMAAYLLSLAGEKAHSVETGSLPRDEGIGRKARILSIRAVPRNEGAFRWQEQLVFEADVVIRTAIPNASYGVNIEVENGPRLLTCISDVTDMSPSCQRVRVVLPDLILTPGRYTLSMAIASNEVLIDVLYRIVSFEIIGVGLEGAVLYAGKIGHGPIYTRAVWDVSLIENARGQHGRFYSEFSS